MYNFFWDRCFLYVRSQLKFIFLLNFFTLLPVIFYLVYSPVRILYLEYAIIVVIILTQYFNFNENQYRKKIEPAIKSYLRKKNNKLASHKEINKLVNIYVSSRNFMIGINILLIIVFSIILKN